MAYPEAQPETFFEWLGSRIKTWLKGDEKRLPIPSHRSVQEKSLLYYLSDYEDLLKNLHKFHKISEDIDTIYNQLRCQKICVSNSPGHDWNVNISKVSLLKSNSKLCTHYVYAVMV